MPTKKQKPAGKNALMEMASTAPQPSHDEMKYRAQDALGTLKRAHEIKNDPHLMKHVHAHAQIEKEALGKIIGRKKRA